MNLSAKTSQEIARDVMLIKLQTAADDLITFYLSVSCPCAFPRFFVLVGFNGEQYTKSIAHIFETNVFTEASIRNSNFLIKNEKNEDAYSCKVCGTQYRYVYEEFSSNFELVRLVAESNKAITKGADTEFPFPLFGGIYLTNGALNDEEITKELDRLQEKFPQVNLEEFITYMKAGI